MKNREILFRGKRVDNGKWIEGSLIVKSKIYIVVDNPYGIFRDEVIPETVGQFTGLTDKNATKIFEGDILYSESNGLGTVIWQNKQSSWAIFVEENPIDNQYFYVLEFGEITGNIHDKI